MKIVPSKTRSLLLAKAPAFALGQGLQPWWSNIRAYVLGRSESGNSLDAAGRTPGTAALHFQADQVAAAVDDALRARLDPLDTQIAKLWARRIELQEAMASYHHALSEALQQPLPTDELDISEHSRKIRKQRDALAVAERELKATGPAARELYEQRNHLHGAARDIVETYSRRSDELSAHHRRGMLSRTNTSSVDASPLPEHSCAYEWAHGVHIPVLAGESSE